MAHTDRPQTPQPFLMKPGPNETPEEFTARVMEMMRGGAPEPPSQPDPA